MNYKCECYQVEAATGGQDVIRFCGGLTAVLAAVGIPLSKALPSSLQPSSPVNPPTLQPDRPGTATVTAAGRAPASRCHSNEGEQQLEQDQSQVPSGQSRDAVAAKQQAAGSATEQVCMQLSAPASRHDHSGAFKVQTAVLVQIACNYADYNGVCLWPVHVLLYSAMQCRQSVCLLLFR